MLNETISWWNILNIKNQWYSGQSTSHWKGMNEKKIAFEVLIVCTDCPRNLKHWQSWLQGTTHELGNEWGLIEETSNGQNWAETHDLIWGLHLYLTQPRSLEDKSLK